MYYITVGNCHDIVAVCFAHAYWLYYNLDIVTVCFAHAYWLFFEDVNLFGLFGVHISDICTAERCMIRYSSLGHYMA